MDGKNNSAGVYLRSVPLRNVFDVQRLLAKLVNQSLQGRLLTPDLSRYAHALNILQGIMESTELIRRVEALEELEKKRIEH